MVPKYVRRLCLATQPLKPLIQVAHPRSRSATQPLGRSSVADYSATQPLSHAFSHLSAQPLSHRPPLEPLPAKPDTCFKNSFSNRVQKLAGRLLLGCFQKTLPGQPRMEITSAVVFVCSRRGTVKQHTGIELVIMEGCPGPKHLLHCQLQSPLGKRGPRQKFAPEKSASRKCPC